MLTSLRIAGAHLVARFGEKSTYVAIVAAVAGGAALNSPYSWLAILFGVAGVLLPTS